MPPEYEAISAVEALTADGFTFTDAEIDNIVKVFDNAFKALVEREKHWEEVHQPVGPFEHLATVTMTGRDGKDVPCCLMNMPGARYYVLDEVKGEVPTFITFEEAQTMKDNLDLHTRI